VSESLLQDLNSTVHAVMADGSRIVHYPDGIWGVVGPRNSYVPWLRLTVTEAAKHALNADEVFLGLAGGRAFDRIYQQLQEEARG